MQKIMFNDLYALTDAAIEGRKTNTRRIEGKDKFQQMAACADQIFYNEDTGLIDFMYEGIDIFNHKPRYKVGEIVAVAQNYFSTYDESKWENGIWYNEFEDGSDITNHAGWINKMFVKAEYMPHQIRIAGIRVERLQDISDGDCLKEGINASNSHEIGYGIPWVYEFAGSKMVYYTPREAFAALIDKVSGRGTWDWNPWVLAYEFELLK